MSEYTIKVCDLCKKEISSLENKHWSWDICKIDLNLKTHVGIQRQYEYEVCTNCGLALDKVIQCEINRIKEARKGE